MTGLLEWLLDLQSIRLASDAPLLLRWDRSLPAWALFGGGVLVLVAIAMAYERERTTRARRTLLAGLRILGAALVAAVLCRPSLVFQRNSVEPAHVAVLIDSSMSMAVRDPAPGDGAGPPSRLDLVRAALDKDDHAALRTLLDRNDVQMFRFAGTIEALGSADAPSSAEALGEALDEVRADGASTDLASAIAQVIERAQGRRLAAIVMATDGRATQSTQLKDALDLAAGRQIPIYPVRVGSSEPVPDLEVGPLRAQDGAFVNDLLAVEAQLSARGLTQPVTVEARLIDERTETTAATETILLDPAVSSTTVELRAKPSKGGTIRYRVEVAALTGEQNLDNNADRIDVPVHDSGLRVLFVDGYPRYEYRYFKNAMLREPTLQVSVLLLEADEQFIQEGTDPIRRFPDTPEELNRFDVVVFGDVDPRGGWLSPAQMNMLLDYVSNEGGGFGMIAGERAAPHRFRGTPLEKLIPVQIDPTFLGRYDAPQTHGFRAQLTLEGKNSRVFRFDEDRASSALLIESLPEMYWFARTLGPKPGAAVLMEHPTLRTATGLAPLVVTSRYGAGKLFFQATDDTWRWRRHTGELLHDGYWVHVVRELMRDRRSASDRRYALRTDRRTYGYGAPVRAQVEIFDAELLRHYPEQIDLSLRERGAAREEPLPTHFSAVRINPQSPLFEGVIVPSRPGGYAVELSGVTSALTERSTSVLIRVDRPDLEARRIEADPETLERIAAATGGRALDLDSLVEGLSEIRDRSVQIPDDVVEPLWDSRLILVIFVLMITLEWTLRKVFGLL